MSDHILNAINNFTTDSVVKSIINSENTRQHACKDWLIEQTENYVALKDKFSVCVAGGWFGLMAHKLRQKYRQRITKLTSFDRDKQCSDIGSQMYAGNKIDFEWQSIENYNPVEFDVIVSTSCEHFSNKALNDFLSRRKNNSIVVLQNNNYFAVKEHINCKHNLQEFADSVDINIVDQMQLDTDAYTRYMIVGR